MKNLFLTVFVLSLLTTASFGQQDPMFTKYMFNSLIYNPAYAGAKDHLAATAIHRDQWWGIDGGPKTQTFTIHTPLNDPKVGVGFAFYNDKIGPIDQMNFNVSYAYRILFNKGTDKEAKLAFGLQASGMNWSADWNQLLIQNPDMAFMANSDNFFFANFGAGIMYYNKYWYLGVAVPHLMNQHFREGEGMVARQFRHYFLSGGMAIPLNQSEDLVFKPSFVIKNSNLFGEFNLNSLYSNVGAPTEFDIDVSFMFFKTLWVGVSFRSAFEGFNGQSSFDSMDIWAAWYLSNGFRIGAAYDYTLNELRNPAQGSFELMLAYELSFSNGTIVTPRYF